MVNTRRRLDPDRRRAEILSAAERLLRARGAAVRVADVVEAAGAAKGTFFVYFPVWDDLLEALREQVFARFEAAHAPAPAATPQAICELAEAFVDEVIAMEGLHPALFHSDFAQRRPLPRRLDPVQRLAGMLEAGVEAGTLPRLGAQATARLLFAVFHEAADAIVSGEAREPTLAAMRRILERSLS